MDAYAAEADRQREAVIERSRETTRAREKVQFEAESARFKQFQQGSLLEVTLHHHFQPKQSLKHVSSGESPGADDSSVRTNA